MATAAKTLLSDLEEDDCVDGNLANGVGCHLNGGVDNEAEEDLSIFKSFFTSDKSERQSAVHNDCSASDMHTSKASSISLSNPGGKESVMEQVKTDLLEICDSKIENDLVSDSLHLKSCPSKKGSCVENEHHTHSDEQKYPEIENTSHQGNCIAEKERSEFSDLTVLKCDEMNTEFSHSNDLETPTINNEPDEIENVSTLNNVERECVDTDAQNLPQTIQESSSLEKPLMGSEQNLVVRCIDRFEKDNNNKKITSDLDSDKQENADPYELKLDLTSCETYERTPLCKKIDNGTASPSKSKSEPSPTKKLDPFNLSGDEDFSPKAYKPIKRKLNQGSADFKANKTYHSEELNDVNGNEKRQKLLEEEDLSLSDMSDRKPVRVAYVYSKELVDKANKLIRIEGRANLVHSLIAVYGILDHVDVIPPRLATETEILGFHCSEYINFLRKLTDADDLTDSTNAEAEAYGLSYDCPVQENVFETASLISGATITAAESLTNGTASIAINWCGGWHHAKRDSASGFCYINDIVLGILKLREKFDRVLYVDLDLHHGDGVEEAFYLTPKVMTVSFHKYAFGFFPGSGSIEDTGTGRGKLYSVNIPLMDGIGDAQFFSVFTSVMKKVRDKFNAEAIVIQCGADALSEDPMASFNLTHVAIAKCVCFLLTWNLPTMLLGGGGYNFANTAKCWTFLTAMAAGKKLPVDIPEHDHLMEYGPSFELMTSQGNRKDCNTKEHFYEIMAKICRNLNCL